MKKILAACVLILGFHSVSHAGVLFEPYVGMESGKTDPTVGKTTGTDFGARLAYKFPMMLWVGLDATMGSVKFKPTVGTDLDQDRTTLYGVVGVNFPVWLRGWIGYGFSDKLKDSGGTLEGKATKIGLGFTGLPFVSINLEYVSESFDKYAGATLPAKQTGKGTILSVSLPLYF